MSDEARKAIDAKKYKRFVSPKIIDEDKRKAARKKAIDSIEKLRPK
jgi:hypothetical protein